MPVSSKQRGPNRLHLWIGAQVVDGERGGVDDGVDTGPGLQFVLDRVRAADQLVRRRDRGEPAGASCGDAGVIGAVDTHHRELDERVDRGLLGTGLQSDTDVAEEGGDVGRRQSGGHRRMDEERGTVAAFDKIWAADLPRPTGIPVSSEPGHHILPAAAMSRDARSDLARTVPPCGDDAAEATVSPATGGARRRRRGPVRVPETARRRRSRRTFPASCRCRRPRSRAGRNRPSCRCASICSRLRPVSSGIRRHTKIHAATLKAA